MGGTQLTVFLALRRLKEVRPRRPEQSEITGNRNPNRTCLNEVRPRRPEQCELLEVSGVACAGGLNEVRPRRPEQ